MNNELKQEIANKGEVLRSLLLFERIYCELACDFGVVVDGIDIGKSINSFENVDRIENLISLTKRELPEWAVKLAKKSFDNRSGFVIWEERR